MEVSISRSSSVDASKKVAFTGKCYEIPSSVTQTGH